MKILQIIPSLGSGGAERFVVDLCNELTRQGADVHLCIVQNPEESDYGFYLRELSPLVQFTSMHQPKGFGIKNVILLARLIRIIQPDVIHSHLGILTYLYFLKPLFINIKFHYTIHSLAEKYSPNQVFRLLNYCYFKFRWIQAITISEECDKSYKQYYGLNNAVRILNGRLKTLPSPDFSAVVDEVDKLKESASDLVFVHVARYHEAKNQELLIRVFNRLHDEHEKFILLIIGDWSFCDNAVELAAKAEDSIHFLGTITNVTDYLYRSDAFCLTSIYEGLPISLLEAVSCGCVPVCTPVGGITEVVQNGVTGYLSEDVTEAAYYAAVKEFIIHNGEIKKEKLIHLFDNRYSIEISAKKHLQLFNGNLNKNA